MSNVINIHSLQELYRFLNEKNVLEIVVRGNNKQIRAIQKVAINQVQNKEAAQLVNQAFQAIHKNLQLTNNGLQLLQNVTVLQNLTLALNCLNLVATCAGFAILYAELEQMSEEIAQQIQHLHQTVKQGHDIQTGYEFNKVLSSYTDMLDARRRQNPYSEEIMRELVDQLYNVLQLLIAVFKKEIATDKSSIILSIFSLLSMLTMSLRFYDELYYFNNKEKLNSGSVWHSAHDRWMGVYDVLQSSWFLERLQDYAFLESDMTTVEMDIYCKELMEEVSSQKEVVEDNQALILALDDQQTFQTFNQVNTAELKETIVSSLDESLDQDSAASRQVYQAIMDQVALI
ncbi:hypothetical protein NF418_06830 [Streptococcus suis]|uniref:hypothetical protein n=1 Tax=Streptococcus suis TaxID=1307 RepID=UPI002117EAC7|nr:hypothetical protein [Streptococcus suis]